MSSLTPLRQVPVPLRREPAILVTGSGRSGTGWLARILQKVGVRAGHEEWWTLADQRTDGLDVDISWLGCMDDGYQGKVLAQVRDPFTCIPSIYAAEHDHKYLLLRSQRVSLTGDWAADACRIWLEWTQHAIDRAEDWWQVETVAAGQLADHFGREEALARALRFTSKDVNHRPAAEWTWPSDQVLLDEVKALATKLGYGWRL